MGEKSKDIPAFPQNTFQKVGGVAAGECLPGMTLRDYFAAAALQGIIGNHHAMMDMRDATSENKNFTMTEVSMSCYAFADAMLKARTKD